jgi:NTP pyrophosphatase (non-canonical NTP hydrolase)
MELNEYQNKAQETVSYKEEHKVILPALGLGSEAGEALGKVQVWLREGGGGNVSSTESENRIKSDLGDVLWYMAALASDLGFSLEEIASYNIQKLKQRKEGGTLLSDRYIQDQIQPELKS